MFRSSILFSLITNKFTVTRKNTFNNALTVKTVKNSKFKRTNVFNNRQLTHTEDQFKEDTETTKGSRKHA